MDESRVRKSSKDQHHSSPSYSSGNCSAPMAVPKGTSGSGSGSSGSLGKDIEPLSSSLSGDVHHRLSSASPNTPSKNSAFSYKERLSPLSGDFDEILCGPTSSGVMNKAKAVRIKGPSFRCSN